MGIRCHIHNGFIRIQWKCVRTTLPISGWSKPIAVVTRTQLCFRLSSTEEEAVEKDISSFLWNLSFKNIVWPSMLVLVCNSSTWKVEVGRWVQGHPQLIVSLRPAWTTWERIRKRRKEDRKGSKQGRKNLEKGKIWSMTWRLFLCNMQ